MASLGRSGDDQAIGRQMKSANLPTPRRTAAVACPIRIHP
jgi:hypothetical protein